MMSARFTLALLTGLCGCSTTATITLSSGDQFEAKILGSEQDKLIVKTAEGAEVPIARSEITDIDHPGNAAAAVGGVLSAYGALNIAAGIPKCSEELGASCPFIFVPAAAGASMLIWGLVTWAESSHAAAGNSPPQNSGAVPAPPSSSAFDFSRR
jgi:hypothetical protein